jgi:hypothetical protein
MIRIEHNVETGEIVEIPLTPEEMIDFKAREKEALTDEQLAQSNKEALLAKLGITAEEAALLLS